LSRHSKRNAFRKFNSVFVFGVLILMLLNFLRPAETNTEFQDNTHSLSETNIKNLISGQLAENAEKYVNDKFTFRKSFLIFKSKLEYITGKREYNGVYVCDNNYLIEKPKEYDVELVDANINAIKNLYGMGGFNVTVSVVPSAYEVLNDYLPDNVYDDSVLKLNTKLKESFSGTGIVYIDSTKLLKRYKDDYLYYRTDNHLTSNGSYVVYHDLADTLGFTALTGEDFKISDVSRSFKGSTYSKALKDVPADVLTVYRPLETPRFKVKFPLENIEVDSMYFPAHLEKEDKYAYFLDGNHALTVINSPNKNGKSIAIFKDSFANSIIPFLAYHYETVHIIDLSLFKESVVKYLDDCGISNILYLYGADGFMSDDSIKRTAVSDDYAAARNAESAAYDLIDALNQ